MPKFALQMKCELENVLEFRIDLENVEWTVHLERGSDGLRKADQTLKKSDEFEMEGSRGVANYIMKWEKGDKAACNISILDEKSVDGTYSADDNAQWKTMGVMEARGCDIIGWSLVDKGAFKIISGSEEDTKNRKVFENADVDFQPDGQTGKFIFFAVDEEGNQVAMNEVETQVVPYKN